MYEIYEKYLDTKTRQGFALQRKAVERLRFYLEGKIAITYVDDKDEEYMNISKGDSDGIANVIRDIEGVELAIFLREEKGTTKASVRSKNSIEYISSREFSNIYGGGGHKGSGGFRIDGTPEENFKEIVEKAVEFVIKASENK